MEFEKISPEERLCFNQLFYLLSTLTTVIHNQTLIGIFFFFLSLQRITSFLCCPHHTRILFIENCEQWPLAAGNKTACGLIGT